MKEGNTFEDKLNDLIELNRIKDQLWIFHPDNKEGVDVVKSYNKISDKISLIESELEVLREHIY